MTRQKKVDLEALKKVEFGVFFDPRFLEGLGVKPRDLPKKHLLSRLRTSLYFKNGEDRHSYLNPRLRGEKERDKTLLLRTIGDLYENPRFGNATSDYNYSQGFGLKMWETFLQVLTLVGLDTNPWQQVKEVPTPPKPQVDKVQEALAQVLK